MDGMDGIDGMLLIKAFSQSFILGCPDHWLWQLTDDNDEGGATKNAKSNQIKIEHDLGWESLVSVSKFWGSSNVALKRLAGILYGWICWVFLFLYSSFMGVSIPRVPENVSYEIIWFPYGVYGCVVCTSNVSLKMFPLNILFEILWFPYSRFPLGRSPHLSPSPLGSRSYIEISSLPSLSQDEGSSSRRGMDSHFSPIPHPAGSLRPYFTQFLSKTQLSSPM